MWATVEMHDAAVFSKHLQSAEHAKSESETTEEGKGGVEVVKNG